MWLYKVRDPGYYIPGTLWKTDELAGTFDRKSRYFLLWNSFGRWKVLYLLIKAKSVYASWSGLYAWLIIPHLVCACQKIVWNPTLWDVVYYLNSYLYLLLDVVDRHIKRLKCACPIKISENVPAYFLADSADFGDLLN